MPSIYISKDAKDNLPERAKNDFYRTERTLIQAVIDHHCDYLESANHRTTSILDVGCGDGRWGQMWGEALGTYKNTFIDIDVSRFQRSQPWEYVIEDDFLLHDFENQTFDLIVSNPPYSIAEEIVRKSWELLMPGGAIIMLLPLNFMASIGRAEGLWKEIYPLRVSVCARRPSFYNGRTAGDEFAVYLWVKNIMGNPVGTKGVWKMDILMHERDKSE